MIGEFGCARGGDATLGLERVLDGHRHTVQRSEGVAAGDRGVGCCGLASGPIEIPVHHGIDGAVEAFDACHEVFECIAGGHLACRDRCCELAG